MHHASGNTQQSFVLLGWLNVIEFQVQLRGLQISLIFSKEQIP
jgi:hypothetical protein